MPEPIQLPPDRLLFASLIERSLEFEHFASWVTPVSQPHTCGWRVLPFLVTAQVVDNHSLIEFADHPSQPVAEGQSLCIPAGVRHTITVLDPRPGLSRWSHVQYRLFTSLDAMTLLRPPFVIGGAAGRRIGDLNEDLMRATQVAEPRLSDFARRKQIGFSLLQTIAEACPDQGHALEALADAQRIAPVLAHIDAHLGSERLDLAHLARIADLSPSRFHAVFKHAIGIPPSRYLQRRRMIRAEELLIGSDLRIHEVATRAGYADPFHFSRLFKTLHGESPLAYRERGAGF